MNGDRLTALAECLEASASRGSQSLYETVVRFAMTDAKDAAAVRRTIELLPTHIHGSCAGWNEL